MRASYGKTEVVAPCSAPMLVMVALPVQEIEAQPGPKNSTTALVPPLTVRMSRSLRITSLGAVQPESLPVSSHADQLRLQHLPGEAGHHVHRVGAADAGGEHAEAAGVRRVGVGADHHAAGEGVVLQHDLVDDARSRASRSRCRSAPSTTRRNVVHLLFVSMARATSAAAPERATDQVVAVHRRRHRGAAPSRRA